MNTIELELILAALVSQEADGEVLVGMEHLQKSYGGKALAMEYDPLRNAVVISLVNESEITYDDE